MKSSQHSLSGQGCALRVDGGRPAIGPRFRRRIASLVARTKCVASLFRSTLRGSLLRRSASTLDVCALESRILWSVSPLAAFAIDVHDPTASDTRPPEADGESLATWLTDTLSTGLDSTDSSSADVDWPSANSAPYVAVAIPARRIEANDLTIILNLSGSFADDDIQHGDRLSFVATSTNNDIVSVATSGRYLSLRLEQDVWGKAIVSVLATDLLGESVTTDFLMDVRQPIGAAPPELQTRNPLPNSDSGSGSDSDDVAPVADGDVKEPAGQAAAGEVALVDPDANAGDPNTSRLGDRDDPGSNFANVETQPSRDSALGGPVDNIESHDPPPPIDPAPLAPTSGTSFPVGPSTSTDLDDRDLSSQRFDVDVIVAVERVNRFADHAEIPAGRLLPTYARFTPPATAANGARQAADDPFHDDPLMPSLVGHVALQRHARSLRHGSTDSSLAVDERTLGAFLEGVPTAERQRLLWEQIARLATRAAHGEPVQRYFRELDRWHASLATVDYGRWLTTSAVTASTLITAGYIHWAHRNPMTLLGSMMTVPAWRFLDPEVLLRPPPGERIETLQSMTDTRGTPAVDDANRRESLS